MIVCPRCGTEAVTAEWVEQCCPLQSTDVKALIFGSGLCATHVQSVFGIDVTRRKQSPPPPARVLAGNDGTLDPGGR